MDSSVNMLDIKDADAVETVHIATKEFTNKYCETCLFEQGKLCCRMTSTQMLYTDDNGKLYITCTGYVSK